MYLATVADTKTVLIANWIWWMIGVALVLTAIRFVYRWATMSAWESVLGSWYSEGLDMSKPAAIAMMFLQFGLLPAMLFVDPPTHGHPWGAAFGGVLLVGLWIESHFSRRRNLRRTLGYWD